MTQDSGDNKNVVKLSDARKKKRAAKRSGASSGNGSMNGAFGKNQKQASQSQSKIWVFIQFILFMGLIAFAMSECRSGI